MTEEEARGWIDSHLHVSRERSARLERYVGLLLAGMATQNLIAESTRDHVWARHIADSAQLLTLAGNLGEGVWMDLGAGAGLPGIVVAILSDRPVQLIESRRKRAEFLTAVADALALTNVTVLHTRLELLPDQPAAVAISARAFAPLLRLIQGASRFAGPSTKWLLPKGRNAQLELDSMPPAWQTVFHVEQSVTDPDSQILVGTGVAVTKNRHRHRKDR